MKRFLIFTLLFPPLALFVFNAPDVFSKRVSALDLLWWMTEVAYIVAIVPAWLLAAVDWSLSAKPTYLRILGTTATGALIADSIVFFLWGGFREFWPVLMAGLVAACPAAICSWLVPTEEAPRWGGIRRSRPDKSPRESEGD